jgi:hypothetical protein
MDRLCRTRPVSALCQYARPTTIGPALRAAVASHPRGVRELTFGSSENGSGLILYGEVDVDNANVLAAVLTAALDAAMSGNRTRCGWTWPRWASSMSPDAERSRTRAGASGRPGRRLLLVDPPRGVERVVTIEPTDVYTRVLMRWRSISGWCRRSGRAERIGSVGRRGRLRYPGDVG